MLVSVKALFNVHIFIIRVQHEGFVADFGLILIVLPFLVMWAGI